MRMPTSSRFAAAARIAAPPALPSARAATARMARPPASPSRLGAAAGSKLGAAAGIAGPAAFTCAWIVASLRQTGHSAFAVQLSGLAAPDARDPGIMIAGFVVLGACSVAFGGSLYRPLGGSERPAVSPGPAGPGARAAGPRAPAAGSEARAAGSEVRAAGNKLRRVRPRRRPGSGPHRAGLGPRLIQWAGALTIAAGLLRRDHMMLGLPGDSWHNHAHDVVSSIIYLTLVVAPLLLAARFRGDASWQRLSVPLVAGSAATAGALAVFVLPAFGSWDPVLQRVAVTIPLAMLAAVAVRLLTVAPARAGSRTSG